MYYTTIVSNRGYYRILEEEKQRLLGESSCYAVKFHHSPPFRERRHSTSEESVRRRREIAARVLAAQKMHRYNPGIKNSGIGSKNSLVITFSFYKNWYVQQTPYF